MQGEFCVGLRGESYPGYRRLLRADLANSSLMQRLTEQHRANGGWGLLKDPLEVRSVLTAAEGPIMINQSFIMCDAPIGSIIRGAFSAKTWGSELPWIASPPFPTDKLAVYASPVGPTSLSPCLFVRAEGFSWAARTSFMLVALLEPDLFAFHLCNFIFCAIIFLLLNCQRQLRLRCRTMSASNATKNSCRATIGSQLVQAKFCGNVKLSL